MLDILFFIRSLQKSGVHFTRIEVATCKAPMLDSHHAGHNCSGTFPNGTTMGSWDFPDYWTLFYGVTQEPSYLH